MSSSTAPLVVGRFRRWVIGARLRTLPAAVVPVCVGTALGWYQRAHVEGISLVGGVGAVFWLRALCAGIVALGFQVGTNYANDYSDGVRGTDEKRVGPLRLVGSGIASPKSVKVAAIVSFLIAGGAGLWLASVTSWWMIAAGAASIAAGWLYTGGPKPYGYLGLGEVFVFLFFGVVATVGSFYVQTQTLALSAFLAAIPVGLLATALLEANNLRDRKGDAIANKRTLAVRLGRKGAGWLYVGSIVGAALGIGGLSFYRPICVIALVGLVPTRPAIVLAQSDNEGPSLLAMLAASARAQLLVGALLVVGLLL